MTAKKHVICPTVTAYSLAQYREQLARISGFAHRIHIDLMDGEFAPTISPGLDEIHLPKGIMTDLHIMYSEPMKVLPQLLHLHPHMVIAHAEADHISSFVHELHEHRIRTGVAILQDTPVEVLHHFIKVVDHVLVFSGNLGHHGGTANMVLVEKVLAIRAMRPDIEIGWDGGINDQNIAKLAQSGVNVLNVGGFIQNAPSAFHNYTLLSAQL